MNEGLFSLWKGHSPFKFLPAFLSSTLSPMIVAISTFDLTSRKLNWLLVAQIS